MKIDFHLHTEFSHDSHARIPSIIEEARRKGLDAIAITDHDTTEGVLRAEQYVKKRGYQLLIIPGVEITLNDNTHLISLFLPPTLQYPPPTADPISYIHKHGGILSIPHPFRNDTGLFANAYFKQRLSASEISIKMKGVSLIESRNAKNHLEYIHTLPSEFTKLVATRPNIGVSDAHFVEEIGDGYTEIPIHASTLKEIRSYITSDRPRISLTQKKTYPNRVSHASRALEFIRRLLKKIQFHKIPVLNSLTIYCYKKSLCVIQKYKRKVARYE